jgi:hypothetical protein
LALRLPRCRFSRTLKSEEGTKFGSQDGNDNSSHAGKEQRVQAVMSRGAYESVEEVVEAALVAIEQRTVPGFAGTPDELDELLAEGLASKEFTDVEF